MLLLECLTLTESPELLTADLHGFHIPEVYASEPLIDRFVRSIGLRWPSAVFVDGFLLALLFHLQDCPRAREVLGLRHTAYPRVRRKI